MAAKLYWKWIFENLKKNGKDEKSGRFEIVQKPKFPKKMYQSGFKKPSSSWEYAEVGPFSDLRDLKKWVSFQQILTGSWSHSFPQLNHSHESSLHLSDLCQETDSPMDEQPSIFPTSSNPSCFYLVQTQREQPAALIPPATAGTEMILHRPTRGKTERHNLGQIIRP